MKNSKAFLIVGGVSLLFLIYTLIYSGIIPAGEQVVKNFTITMSILFSMGVLIGAWFGFKKPKKELALLIPFLIPVILQAQDATGFVVEESWQGFKELFDYINVPYLLVYMAVAWIINDWVDVKKPAAELSKWSKVRKTLISIIVGVVVGFIWAYFFGFNTKEQYFSLTISMIVAMVIYKLGINQVFSFISKKIGLKIKSDAS